MFDLLNGLAVGLAISAPLGPIGMLCLNYAFTQGFRLAVFAGLGAAVADTIYASITGFGLTFLSEWLLEHYLIFGIFGGLFLIYLGYRIFTSAPIERIATVTHTNELQAFLSTLLFTISNPLTLIVFATLFGCLTTTERIRTHLETSFLVIGVFAGSMLWWTILSLTASLLRSRINIKILNLVRKVVGTGIMSFGAFFMLYTFR
ncbi:MAG: hypothetical protein K940chlam3_01517 [Chlamydiae bacterium]|nr:hypothetical protein [Chlamydiota bacterium]